MIASRPETRWTEKTTKWNPGLSMGAKACRAVGRHKNRWEEDINHFFKPEETDETQRETTWKFMTHASGQQKTKTMETHGKEPRQKKSNPTEIMIKESTANSNNEKEWHEQDQYTKRMQRITKIRNEALTIFTFMPNARKWNLRSGSQEEEEVHKPHCGSCTHGSHRHTRSRCLARQKVRRGALGTSSRSENTGTPARRLSYPERRDACHHAACRRCACSRRTTFQIYGAKELKQLRIRVCHTLSLPSLQESEDSRVFQGDVHGAIVCVNTLHLVTALSTQRFPLSLYLAQVQWCMTFHICALQKGSSSHPHHSPRYWHSCHMHLAFHKKNSQNKEHKVKQPAQSLPHSVGLFGRVAETGYEWIQYDLCSSHPGRHMRNPLSRRTSFWSKRCLWESLLSLQEKTLCTLHIGPLLFWSNKKNESRTDQIEGETAHSRKTKGWSTERNWIPTASRTVYRTPHCTHVCAHFSCEHSMRDVWLKGWTILWVCENNFIPSHVSCGWSVSSVSCDSLNTNLFSDATFRIIYTTDWHQKTLPVPLRRGLEMSGLLANPTPDTGYEPMLCVDVSDEHTPINLPDSNGNFPHDYDATIATTEDLDVPRHSRFFKQQQTGFSPCRSNVHLEIASRHCWRIMILMTVVMESGNLCRPRWRNRCFHSFQVWIKGEERSRPKRCAIVRRLGKSRQNPWAESLVCRPTRKIGSAGRLRQTWEVKHC